MDAVTTAAEGVDGVESVTPVHRSAGRRRCARRRRSRRSSSTGACGSTSPRPRPPTRRTPSTPSRSCAPPSTRSSPTALVGGAARRDAGHQPGQRAGPARDRPGRAPGHRRDPDAAAALGRRRRAPARRATSLSFAAALGVSAIVFNHVLGFAGADPVGAAVRVRVPRRARRRLLDLPDDPRPRGVAAGRDARGRRPRARRDGWRDHLGGRRARHDVRGARRHPAAVPGADRVHRRLRRAARHVRRPQPARARPWCTTSGAGRGGRARCPGTRSTACTRSRPT